MKWIETITPKQAVEELGVPYHGWMREMDRAWISEDQKYSVMSRLLRTEWGKVEHVTITAAEGVGRSDGSGDIPWAVKMEIKNDLFGEKRVAVEVFPTQDRLVDVCDCYHLWVFELYAADHGKLNDGDSFTTKLNNCVLTISLKDGSLDVQFDPDADVAVDTPYTLDMKLDIYEEEDNG